MEPCNGSEAFSSRFDFGDVVRSAACEHMTITSTPAMKSARCPYGCEPVMLDIPVNKALQ